MEEHTRRTFLIRAAALALAAGGVARARTPETPPERRPLRCTDLTGLDAAQRKTRADLKYTEQSPKPRQSCGNCMHLQPTPYKDTPCKACTVVPGPVNPNGWCTAWVERISSPG